MISLLNRLRRSTRAQPEETYAPVHPALIVALAPSSTSIETLAADNASVKSFSSVERVPPTYDESDEAAAQALADARRARVMRTDRAIGDACKAYGF